MDFPPHLPATVPLEDLADGFNMEEHVADRFLAEELRRRVAGLGDPYRAVITWRFGLLGPEHSRRTVGRQLRMSPHAVALIERRALTALRRSYGHRHPCR